MTEPIRPEQVPDAAVEAVAWAAVAWARPEGHGGAFDPRSLAGPVIAAALSALTDADRAALWPDDPSPEAICPSCGATIRTRMADEPWYGETAEDWDAKWRTNHPRPGDRR